MHNNKKTHNEIETMIHTIMIGAQVNDCLIISWSLRFLHYAICAVWCTHIQRILPKYVNVDWIWHTIHLGIYQRDSISFALRFFVGRDDNSFVGFAFHFIDVIDDENR